MTELNALKFLDDYIIKLINFIYTKGKTKSDIFSDEDQYNYSYNMFVNQIDLENLNSEKYKCRLI
jgi:hypothetical protein